MSKFKDSLIKMALNQRHIRLRDKEKSSPDRVQIKQPNIKIADELCRFKDYPNYKAILQKQILIKKFKIKDPFFLTHEGIASATSVINQKSFINFSSYNYLNLNGDQRVINAAKEAIDRYGTSVSASRLVSGERPIHQELEHALAQLHNVDDALIFVSGHATNVSTIGYLFGPKDLILHDALIHDSVLQGIKLSGAFRLPFPHNDWEGLNDILIARRHQFERVLIIIEGIYSMDGDYPDLPQFIEVKKRHKAFLMVDEAHSIGVMGKCGRGIGEFFGVHGDDVDIWMGTLSKTLAGCGGYIAGCNALVQHLKYMAPGFLYSVGMSPPLAAASLKALEIMQSEPNRIDMLHARARQFLEEAKQNKLNVGFSMGLNIIPIIYDSSKKSVQISNELYEKGVNVQPIIYPAVPDNQARLRFFINCTHTQEQISFVVELLRKISNLHY